MLAEVTMRTRNLASSQPKTPDLTSKENVLNSI